MDEVVVLRMWVRFVSLQFLVCALSFPCHSFADSMLSAAAEDSASGEVRIIAGWELVSVPPRAGPVEQGLFKDVDVLRSFTSQGIVPTIFQVSNDLASVRKASTHIEPSGSRYGHQVCLFCLPSDGVIESIVLVNGRSAELRDPVAVVHRFSDEEVADISAR